MQRFCVRCGKASEKVISGLCIGCFLEKNPVLDIAPKMALEYDHISGRIRQGRLWVEKSLGLFEQVVKDAVLKAAAPKRMKVEDIEVLLDPHDDNINAVVSFVAEVEGVKVRLTKKINLILRKSVSDATTKLSSNYFEATIQVRFLNGPAPKDIAEKLEEVLAALKAEKKRNEMSQATAIKKTRKGIDVVVGSFKAADKVSQRLARKYGLKVIYSNSLFGVDDSGKNKYRHTYCIKFPN